MPNTNDILTRRLFAAAMEPADDARPVASEDAAELHTDEPDAEPANTWNCEGCGAEIDGDDDEGRPVLTGTRWGVGISSRQWVYEHLCADCAGDAIYINDWRSCSELLVCHGWVSRDQAGSNYYYHEGCDEWYSFPEESEDEEEESRDDRLLSYSTDIFNVLRWPSNVRRDALAFGVELEIEGRDGHSSNDLVHILGGSNGTRTGKAILKYDGSLDDGRGCEIVTLPQTLEQHQSPGLWDVLLDSRLLASARSGVGTNNCGMHVHINRRALSALTIGKMVVFLNNPDNGGFVTAVAQRQSGSYCQRDGSKKLTDVLCSDASRYDIINISGGATVEVRMFKGNLRRERVLKNVEFCHALVRFCESHGITDSQRWGTFAEWISKQRKAYPNLCSFLAEKGYFPAKYQKATLADA